MKMPQERGFSVVELMVVVGIVMVLVAMAVMSSQTVLPAYQANWAMNQVFGQLRMARAHAISSRRNIDVSFPGLDAHGCPRIRLTPETYQSTPGVPLPDVSIGSGVQQLVVLVPTDTPMAFGNGSALSFSTTSGPAVEPIKFSTTGQLIDSSGNLVNGTIFLGIPTKPGTARAVTVMGGTGRVRQYRWNGSAWAE